MKKMFKIIAVTAALTLAAATFAACGSNAQSKVESAASAAASAVESAASAVESAAANAAADLSKVDITIAEGDYAAMETFAKELQNVQNEGKVVKVTGINSRSNFGAKASVMVSDGGSQKVGTTYIITGVDSIDGYPENDATIEITGVVTKDASGMFCYIAVPADMVVVK